MLGGGGSRCDGSCISGFSTGRSTGGACLGGRIPARRLRRSRSPRSPMPPGGGFSPRSTRPRLDPAWHRGCRWRMRFLFIRLSPPPRPSPRRMPPHSEGWRNGAAATARGPLPTGQTGCASISPARPICGAGRPHSPPISRPGSIAGISPAVSRSPTRSAPPGRWPASRKARASSSCRRGIAALPRDALTRRFGEMVARRLDQAQGDLPEPLSPLGEAPTRRVRLSFAEPIADPADLTATTERLVEDLVPRLAREGIGARRLDLAFHRIDGRVERIRLGTARPSRDPGHLAALFKERLDTVDPGLGIEDVILAVFAVEPLSAEQIGFPGHPTSCETSGIAPLLDRLGNRLGLAALSRLEPRASHIPERASVLVPVGSAHSRTPVAQAPDKPPRPIRLFEPQEAVEAFWLLPDDPPFRFTWRRRRHRVTRADGPERIADEWWRPEGCGTVDAIRDYYRVEDEEGRRFWLFRSGFHGGNQPPRWFVHGVFS